MRERSFLFHLVHLMSTSVYCIQEKCIAIALTLHRFVYMFSRKWLIFVYGLIDDRMKYTDHIPMICFSKGDMLSTTYQGAKGLVRKHIPR